MKKDIHPEQHPVIFLDSSNGSEYRTMSTAKSEETKEIDGITYFVIKVEVTSSSHPFYTGKQRFVDTTGQVEKFQKRAEKIEIAKAKAGTKSKKSKQASKDTKKAAKDALKAASQG